MIFRLLDCPPAASPHHGGLLHESQRRSPCPASFAARLAHPSGGDRRRLPAGAALLRHPLELRPVPGADVGRLRLGPRGLRRRHRHPRSEEHTSELQSLMRISYAVFCLKKKTINIIIINTNHTNDKKPNRLITHH